MKMTRQHFKLIAEALKSSKPVPDEENRLDLGEFLQWNVDCGVIANALATTNPYFKKATFLEACGVE